jgi:hypothetical protein
MCFMDLKRSMWGRGIGERMVRKFLQLEALAIFLVLLVAYHNQGYSWKVFLLFILVPDVSMAGYLVNPRAGAIMYNIGHSYILPITILVISGFMNIDFGRILVMIWAIHIAGDRALGFGTKEPTGFKNTHLN